MKGEITTFLYLFSFYRYLILSYLTGQKVKVKVKVKRSRSKFKVKRSTKGQGQGSTKGHTGTYNGSHILLTIIPIRGSQNGF